MRSRLDSRWSRSLFARNFDRLRRTIDSIEGRAHSRFLGTFFSPEFSRRGERRLKRKTGYRRVAIKELAIELSPGRGRSIVFSSSRTHSSIFLHKERRLRRGDDATRSISRQRSVRVIWTFITIFYCKGGPRADRHIDTTCP